MNKKVETCLSFRLNLQSQKVTFCRIAVSFLLLILLSPMLSYAQKEPEYDEISVSFEVQGIGITEMPAVIRDEVVYLSITNVFDFLKIKNNPSPGFESVSGFFIDRQATYLVDRVNRRILYQNRVFNLKLNDLIRTETNLYLKSDYFGEVFGLYCTFNFRGLSVILNTKIELPAIREMRQEQMRKNISRLKGEIKADTIVGRDYPFFRFGMADWSVNTEQSQGWNDVRLSLGLGATLAGGETKVLINYDNNEPFTERQQYYLWHFVNNDNYAFRQIMAGTISTQSISSIYAPIVGTQLTNTPTTYRRSFGSYTLSDYTEPNWIVELYVNNVLVDYVKSDASGFFIFEVPLVYGNSDIKLRFYGPEGEERTTLQNITIPFNFLPQKEFEYTVSAGTVEDGSDNLFSRVNFNYGVDRHITVGSGIEYFSSVASGKGMPFLNTSLSLTSSLLFSGEYVNGVRSKGILNYRLPSNLQFEIDYTKYDKDQEAINTNFLEDRKAVISMPFSFGNSTIYSRFTINQIVLPTMKNIMSDLLLSGSIFGVSVNSSTFASYTDPFPPYVYGNLSLSFRLPTGFIVTPQMQYDYNQKKLIFVKCEFEKQLFGHGYLDMIYEKDFINNINDYQIVLRYEFPSAQTSASVRRDNNATSFIQSANGSLMFDGRTNHLGTDNQPSVGKGGIIIVPFLDLNCNGRRDEGEPKAFGLNFSINNGRIERDNRDTTIRIFDLEPYVTYTIELDRNSFDNISWLIRKPIISVFIDPNQFKLIEVPIAVVGEVSGTVYLRENNSNKGQGRITLCFYRSDDSSLAASTLTEADGFFSFLGLAPGSYVARIDTAQLRRLNMTSSPIALPVNILQNKDGYVVDELEFVLQSLHGDTSAIPVKVSEQRIVPSEKPQIVEEKVIPPPQVVQKKVAPPPQVVQEKVVPPPQVVQEKVVPPPQVVQEKVAPPPQVAEEKAVPPQIVEEKVVPPPQIVEEKVVPPPQIVEEKVEQPPPIIKTEMPCIVISDAKKTGYILQISPWITKSKVGRVAKKVEKFHGLQAYVMTAHIPSMGLRYRVFIGVFKTKEEAVAFCQQFNFDL
jgi:hypothetical protein